jgi:hypothetical protein
MSNLRSYFALAVSCLTELRRYAAASVKPYQSETGHARKADPLAGKSSLLIVRDNPTPRASWIPGLVMRFVRPKVGPLRLHSPSSNGSASTRARALPLL